MIVQPKFNIPGSLYIHCQLLKYTVGKTEYTRFTSLWSTNL